MSDAQLGLVTLLAILTFAFGLVIGLGIRHQSDPAALLKARAYQQMTQQDRLLNHTIQAYSRIYVQDIRLRRRTNALLSNLSHKK